MHLISTDVTIFCHYNDPKTPFLDEPGPPRNLEVVDWDQDRVDLKWEAPESDGGAPITAYVVECKERYSSSWVRCCLTETAETSASVREIIEAGKTYEFRVRAVNKAGPGKPSEPTKPVCLLHYSTVE